MKLKSKRHLEVQQPVFVGKECISDDDWHVEGDDDEEMGSSRETSLGGSPGETQGRRRVTQRHEFKMKIKASREEIAEFERFSKEVEEVRPLFDEMSALVRRMRRIAGDDALYSAESEQEFDELKEQVNEVSTAIRSKILMHQNDQKNRKGPFAEVKGKILATLINELVGQTNRYKEVLVKHDKSMQDRVARYIHEVNEEQEEESAERYDEHMKPDTFFQRYVFKEEATRVRNHLKEKNRDIAKIEKDLVELQSVMQDIGALVEHQNELLDQIEHNIDSAKATVERATQEVEETRVIVQQIRRKKLMTFLTIGLIVVIVIVVIVVVAVILL